MPGVVVHTDARSFASEFQDGTVTLLLTDPPYGDILDTQWDRKWDTPEAYAEWFVDILQYWRPKLTPTGSIIFFGGTGKPGSRMLLHTMLRIEDSTSLNLHFRQWITWKKRRGYGKSHDYLYCREEILWYSAAPGRTDVTFNIPLLDEKRGYAGWNEKYPAKSEFKRVSNVWADIGEVMRPTRDAEKPIPLMERLIATHSNPGDLVVDPFCGLGTTGVAAMNLGRLFRGADVDGLAVAKAQQQVSLAPPLITK